MKRSRTIVDYAFTAGPRRHAFEYGDTGDSVDGADLSSPAGIREEPDAPICKEPVGSVRMQAPEVISMDVLRIIQRTGPEEICAGLYTGACLRNTWARKRTDFFPYAQNDVSGTELGKVPHAGPHPAIE